MEDPLIRTNPESRMLRRHFKMAAGIFLNKFFFFADSRSPWVFDCFIISRRLDWDIHSRNGNAAHKDPPGYLFFFPYFLGWKGPAANPALEWSSVGIGRDFSSIEKKIVFISLNFIFLKKSKRHVNVFIFSSIVKISQKNVEIASMNFTSFCSVFFNLKCFDFWNFHHF